MAEEFRGKMRRSLDPKTVAIRKELLGIVLLKATKEGCRELGTSGLGFVLSSFSYWAMECREVGLAKPVARYLRALADMLDAKSEAKLMQAEHRRRRAFEAVSDLAEQLDAQSSGFFQQLDRNDPQP